MINSGFKWSVVTLVWLVGRCSVMSLTISYNSLVGIITSQTLDIEGHIKKKKVKVLIDSGSTHNFIHCKVAKELNFFLYQTPECQVMVANGGTIN